MNPITNKCRMFSGSAITLMLLCLFTPFAANSEPYSVTLEPIVVSATRLDKVLFDTPYTGYTISSEIINAERMVRSLPDSLTEVPGVMVQKTAYGQGSPYIRGLTGFRNLFLIDGIRLNNSVFRDGPNQYWNTVDPYSIETMEILSGPASVLYGSDAIGGIVNAISRKPDYKDGNGYNAGGRLDYRWSNAEHSNIGRGEAGLTCNKKWGFTFGYSLKSFGDLEGGKDVGLQKKTGYDEWDGDLKFEYMPTTDSKMTLVFQKTDQDDIWRTHKTIYGINWEGTTIGDELARTLDQDRDLAYLQYFKENIGSFIDKIQLSLSYHSQDELNYRLRTSKGTLKSDLQGVDVNTTGLSVQMDSKRASGSWTSGIEYYHDDVNSYKNDYNGDARHGGTLTKKAIQGPVADDASYSMAGVYIQDDLPVSDKFNLVTGGRYNRLQADADKVQDPLTNQQISISKNWSALAGSLRGVYKLGIKGNYNLYGGISQGFRAPNLSDLTRLDTARSKEIETPSPGLNPERYITYETGLKIRYQTLSSQWTYYYTDIRDMIVRAPTGRIIDGNYEVTKKNSGDGYIQGVELTLSWLINNNFSAFGSFSWQDGEIEGYPDSTVEKVEEPVSRLMPATMQTGLRWEPGNYWIEGIVVIADKQDKLAGSDIIDTQRIPPGGTPGYTVFTVRGGWKITRSITVSGTLENLGNVDYRIHGSGVNEPGRNFIINLDYKF
jgi:hemoglobin/transferrin/lactoferrin receptor protein